MLLSDAVDKDNFEKASKLLNKLLKHCPHSLQYRFKKQALAAYETKMVELKKKFVADDVMDLVMNFLTKDDLKRVEKVNKRFYNELVPATLKNEKTRI